jgi:transketolase
MAAIQNGMIAYGGFYVFSATFFVFADYVRPAMRVAAISKLPAIYLFSHDSFYVGEDGATHEPIEQLPSLRAMPNTVVIRPADPTETAQAWLAALRNTTGPTAILVTRQNLEPLDRSIYPAPEMLEKGAYVLCQTKSDEQPDAIIIATGSEVQLALKAYEQLKAEGRNIRVVNMPSCELFERQTKKYRDSVLPKGCKKRIVIEAASSFGWERYIGQNGLAITIDHFGASAPYKVLEQKFGFTAEAVVEKIKNYL